MRTSAIAIIMSIIWPLAPAAIAQQAAAGAAAGGDQPKDSGPSVADIVVTAQFRAQNLQDVPIAIEAVNADTLSSSGVRTTDDLQIATTGINIQRQTGASLIFIRGIGTAGGQAAQEGAIATFIDGVYQPSPSSVTGSLANIERVEVLKGPQGTLYGRNATGGAVNIITLTPSFEPTGLIEFGYGNLQTVQARAYVSSGITKAIAADVSLYYNNQMKGFGRNLYTGTEISKGEDFAVRSKILFELGEDTKFTLGGDYNSSKGSFGVPQRVAPGAVLIDTVGLSDLPGVTPFPGGFYDAYTELDPYIHIEGYGFSGTLEHHFGDVSLTSITAWRSLDIFTQTDSDGTSQQVTSAYLTEKNKQFTQELRLQGDSGPFNWLVGGFFLHSKAGYAPFDAFGSAIRAAFGGAPTSPDRLLIENNLQKTTSYAAFGQITWSVGEATDITAGLRYTHDKRSINPDAYVGYSTDRDLLIPVPVALGAVAPGGDTSGFFAQQDSFSKLTWRLAIDQKITPDLLAYASYNRGFKSGIFNTTSFGNPAVKPEVLDAYEVGFKSTLLDRRLRLNGAAFYYDYSNIQLSQLVGSSQVLLNAAVAEIYGGEASFEAAITDAFSLRGGVAYTHGRYKSFPNAPFFEQAPGPGFGSIVTSGDAGGNRTVYTPPWQINLAADYSVPVGDGELAANISYLYVDKFYFTADNRSPQPSYDLVNTQLKYTSDAGLVVTLWGRNIFDKQYFASRFNAPAGETVVAAAGRTYGVSLGYKF